MVLLLPLPPGTGRMLNRLPAPGVELPATDGAVVTVPAVEAGHSDSSDPVRPMGKYALRSSLWSILMSLSRPLSRPRFRS